MKGAETTSQNRILDAAEELFAKRGFNATSMRLITTHAKVNLAAVNYHFGSKEALYADMMARRLRPINEARLASLARAEQEAAGQPVPLARVIELLVRPVFELSRDPSRGGSHIIRIVGRSLAEPLPFM